MIQIKTPQQRYQDYIRTPYFKEVAKAVKARAGYRCQTCNSQLDLCAHHRNYDHRGNEMEHLDDMTCLCKRCHTLFHIPFPDDEPKQPQKPWSAYVPEERPKVEYPDTVTVMLTLDMVNACRTERHGFTYHTMDALGADGQRGWVRRLVGKTITRAAYQAALDGRHIFVPCRRRRRR